MKRFNRFKVLFELDSRIRNEIATWERQNIPEIILQKMRKMCSRIYRPINALQKDMSGLEPPFDTEHKIFSVLAGFLAPSGTGLVASFLLNRLLLLALPGGIVVALGGFLIGTFISAAVALDITSNFEEFCTHAYEARINALTKEKIKALHRKIYAKSTGDIFKGFLIGNVKNDIEFLQKLFTEIENDFEDLRGNKEAFCSLKLKTNEIEQPLRDFFSE